MTANDELRARWKLERAELLRRNEAGESQSEIARSLGVTRAAVRARLILARSEKAIPA